MSIHLFFNVITAFVDAQFIALSKFLNACEIEECSDYSFNHCSVAYLS